MNWMGRALLVPSWVYWLTALTLLFVSACRAYWVLEKERENKRTSEPTIALENVLRRILKKDDYWAAPSNSQEVSNALSMIREKAALGVVCVFGRHGWRGAAPKDLNLIPRTLIPQQEWKEKYIDYMMFMDDRRGNLTGHRQSLPEYVDLWFDRTEINKVWPEPWRFPWHPEGET